MDNCKEKIDLGHYWDLKDYVNFAQGHHQDNDLLSKLLGFFFFK